MAVINGEEGASWPIFYRFEFRFNDIQNNADSIFIIIPNHALVSVGGIGYDNSVFLTSELSCVVVLFEAVDLIFFHLLILLALFICHFHPTINYNIFRLLFYDLWFIQIFYFDQWLVGRTLFEMGTSPLQRISRINKCLVWRWLWVIWILTGKGYSPISPATRLGFNYLRDIVCKFGLWILVVGVCCG